MAEQNIPFIDLDAQRKYLGSKIDEAVLSVINRGQFIMGAEVKELEAALSEYTGAKHVIGCANGTDAIVLSLMAEGIGPGDAVIVPSFTFIASAEAIALVGATPIFCDVDARSFNISPKSVTETIAFIKTTDLTLKAIIAVDMFGLSANYPELQKIADENNMALISDSAQGFGSSIDGVKSGNFGKITTTSFFPAKPLGCYGDGGAILTNDDETAELLRSIRIHGKGSDKYDNVRIGQNSRLDTIQAAILLQKMSIFAEEVEKRNIVANRYTSALSNYATTPHVPEGYESVWAQYTLIVDDREKIASACKEANIPTAVYYPIPMHQQTAYKHYPCLNNGVLETSESLSKNVISLPMHPYMDEEIQDFIIKTVQAAL